MQLRYIVLLCFAGLFGAWHCQNVLLAYVAAFGCAGLYGLRRIDYRIGDLKGRSSLSVPYARTIRRHVPGATSLQPIFAGDLAIPQSSSRWELEVSLTAPDYLERPVVELSMRRRSGGRHASRYPTEAETEEFLANPPPYMPSQFWIVDHDKIHRGAWSAGPGNELLLDLQRGAFLRACRRPEHEESTDNAVRAFSRGQEAQTAFAPRNRRSSASTFSISVAKKVYPPSRA
jgi:hypothetical protein